MAVSFDLGVVNFGSINEGGAGINPVPLQAATIEPTPSLGANSVIWRTIVAAYPTASFTRTSFFVDFLYLDTNPDFRDATADITGDRSELFFRVNFALFPDDDNLDEPDEAFSLQQPTLVTIDIRDSSGAPLARLFPDQIAALYASVGGLTVVGQVTGTIIDNDLPPNTAPTAVSFINTTPDLDENSDTTDRIKVADVTITDDGAGTNNLSLTGSDADAFELDGTVLYLKAGTTLDYESGKTSYSVTVNVDDPAVGNTPDASNTFTLQVNDLPENVAPVANLDTQSTSQNTPLTISGAALLANDTDADGDALSITEVKNATGGTVSFNSGNVLFIPNSDFAGAATFDYTITDGQETATATVTVNVASVAGINRSGGNGRDTLIGGLGRDTLSGGNGDDIINGGAGGDTLRGDNGNDRLIGGTGSDTVTGGNGSDVFVLAAGAGTDTFTDFKIGTDVIGLSGGLSFGQLSFSGNQILASGETLATLTGINATTLTQSSFITV